MSEKAAATQHMKDREMKSPPNHIQTMADSYYLFQWVGCTNENVLTDQVKEYHDMIAHFGNKVLLKKRDETDLDVAWMQAHYDVCATFRDFCINNAGGMWHWNGKGKDSGLVEWFESASNPANLNDF